MKSQIRLWLVSATIALIWLPVAFAQQRPRPPDQRPYADSRAVYDRPSPFPLEVGNEWIYSDGTARIAVQVLRETIESNGFRYFEVMGFWPDDPVRVHKLRRAFPDQVYEYNPDGDDFLWYQFGNLQGSWQVNSESEIPCVTGSSVSIGAIGSRVEVPAGIFERTVRLDFIPRCMDGGVSKEFFAPGVGLVQRVLNTFAGPRTVRLVAAHIAGSDWPRDAYAIGLSLDRPVYYNNLMPPVADPWPTARVVLTIRNETDFPVQFMFPTSQRFDFVVCDALGEEVLRWSDGRVFLQVAGQERLVNRSLRYGVEIVLKTNNGKIFPAGLYSITGYLTNLGANSGSPKMAASVIFEIRDTY